MGWRSAKSIDSSVGLGDEIQATNPSVTLYFIGDEAHCPGSSDHCACSCCAVVCAVDVMKNGGPNLDALAEHVRQRVLAGDQRTKYLIWNRRIFSGHGQSYPPGQWRDYTGSSNPHTDHVHLSVRHGSSLYDDSASWGWSGTTPPPQPVVPPTTAPPFPLPKCTTHNTASYFGPKDGPDHSVSGYYSHTADLKQWQQRMKDRGWTITPDGLYGPETESVARSFQAEKGLAVDGLVGAQTWSTAWTAPVT